MQTSLLPNILQVAERNNLEVDSKSINKKEVRYKCPFCEADANRSNKFFLSVNEEKNVFKCWYCKESGGVLKFISLLEGKSEQDLIEEIRQQSGSHYKKHPAERLTKSQLKMIGYPDINWVKNREYDYHLYKDFRDKVWNEWISYVSDKKRFCYQILFVGICSGEFNECIKKVKEVEKEIGEEFLDDLLNLLFQESKGDKTFQVESTACELVGRTHPYETYLINKSNLKNDEGEDFQMLNKCVFVGRLGSDVELRYTPNGKAVANFNLALTRAVPNQNGDREADFIRCIVWNKPAENMANQLSKGDTIAIEARVQTRSFDGQDGKRVFVTEFVVEGFPQFLKVKKWENGNNNSNNGNYQNQGQPYQNQGQPTQNQDPFTNAGQPIDINDDELPF